MPTDDDQFDPWAPERPAARSVSPIPGRVPGGQARPPLATGWPGARWRLDRATVAVLVLVLLVAVGAAGFLLLRRPGGAGGVAVPDAAPEVSGVPGPTSSGPPVAAGSFRAAVLPSGQPSVQSSMQTSGQASAGGPLRVHMIGQVRHPGVVNLPAGSRVEDAVDAAGGATRRADLTAINLARAVSDGEQIYLPKPGEKPRAAVDSGVTGGSAGVGAVPGAAAGPLDLNAATLAQLDELPGVGPVLAQRILEYRQQRGRLSQVDELGDVQGIGDATLEKLRPLVRV